MTIEAKSPPPPGVAAVPAQAAPACAPAQAAVIPAMRGMARSRRFSPSLIVRTRHHRPERGPIRPDKETP
jgi:hypothetical protein